MEKQDKHSIEELENSISQEELELEKESLRLCKSIARELKTKQMSHTDLAILMNVDVNTISRWLGGVNFMSFDILKKIEKILGVHIFNKNFIESNKTMSQKPCLTTNYQFIPGEIYQFSDHKDFKTIYQLPLVGKTKKGSYVAENPEVGAILKFAYCRPTSKTIAERLDELIKEIDDHTLGIDFKNKIISTLKEIKSKIE